MKVRHFRSGVLLGITLALSAACVQPGERAGSSGSSASVCPEGVRISAAGNVVGLVSGHIRQCFPGEANCFCDRDDDCYALSGYVACTPPAADAGSDAAVDAAPPPDAVMDGASTTGGVCPEAVRISAAGNVVGVTSGHIRQCFPGEANCFCDRDDDCYALSGYVACTPPAADAGADATSNTNADVATDTTLDAADGALNVCPEGVRIGVSGNPVGLLSGHIRYCFPGEARCFCDRDNDCYAESGYVPCVQPVADAGTDAAPDAPVADAAVDASFCTDGATPIVAPSTESALAASRQSCAFGPGARVADTLGITAAARARIPLDHVVILMQENRSFDHYLGTLAGDVDRIPAGYTNRDALGRVVSPARLPTTCEPYDPPHQWDAMHTGWNNGAMDGFARAAAVDGVPASAVLGYYTAADLPFYHWLYGRFAMSDRYFGSVLGGTWANRNFLYAGSSYGIRNTLEGTIGSVPTVFDALDNARVPWGVYTDGDVRQDSIGWTNAHRGVYPTSLFFSQLAAGTLPPVVFLDPWGDLDEHPASNVQRGEGWTRDIVTRVMASPLWPTMALIVTYDESGGFFDHVAPPSACLPHPASVGYDITDLNRLGLRVPFVVVSPWARAHYVSHVAHDHGATLRFIEMLFDLPALTGRDANASALLDMFDFSCPQNLTLGEAVPPSGVGGCPARP